jgi:hypothetical protein
MSSSQNHVWRLGVTLALGFHSPRLAAASRHETAATALPFRGRTSSYRDFSCKCRPGVVDGGRP